jgi:hypothetical protein
MSPVPAVTNQVNRLGRLRAKERMIAKDRDLIWLEGSEFRHDRFECGEIAVNV